MKKFIVFEGVCTAGKTTSSTEVAKQLGLKYNKGVFAETEIGKNLKAEADFGKNYSDTLYLSDLIIDTKKNIKPLLDSGQAIIQDRYSDSVIAYSKAFSILLEEKYDINQIVQKLMDAGLLLKCDLIVYFFADVETLLSRMRNDASCIHNSYLNNPNLLQTVMNEYEKLLELRKGQGIEVVKIDTTYTTIEDNIELVKKMIS